MSKDYQQLSYSMLPGGESSWRFSAGSSATSWLEKLALIMGLVPSVGNVSHVVYCVKSNGWWDRQRSPISLLNRLNARHAPRAGWKPEDFGSIRLWHHQEIPDFLCELKPATHYAGEVQQMWHSMQAVYRGLGKHGGLPLHSALIERDGTGVLIVAGAGTGKTTCCRRVPPPWKVLCDDLTLVIPSGDGRYFGHPLPTWSDHISSEWHNTWDVQSGVPLCGVFFLEQAKCDKAIRIGQGRAAVDIARSASYVVTRDWLDKDPARDREARKTLFYNSTRLTQSVRPFSLRASLTGAFWNEIEDALASYLL